MFAGSIDDDDPFEWDIGEDDGDEGDDDDDGASNADEFEFLSYDGLLFDTLESQLPSNVHFEWSNVPTGFQEPKPPFADPTSGTNEAAVGIDATDTFLLLMDDVIDVLVEETDRYGRNKHGDNWDSVNMSRCTFFKWLAICLYMTLNKHADFRTYWNESAVMGSLFCKSLLPRDTWLKIWRSLSAVNKEKAKEMGKSDSKSEHFDELWRVRDIYQMWLENNCEIRRPKEVLVVDERMIKFKGHWKNRIYLFGKWS